MSTTRSTSPKAPATDPAALCLARGRALMPCWADSALLLLGHGSTRRTEAGPAAHAHAVAIGARGLFREVRACFLKGRPGLEAVFRELARGPVYVVPYLMADGYVSRSLIPQALARANAATDAGAPTADSGGQGSPRPVLCCPPVGAHPGIAEVIVRHVAETAGAHGLDMGAVSVLLVGHGTPKDPASGDTARGHAIRLAARRRFKAVTAAFLEEPPRLAEAVAALGPGPVIVVGLFTERGVHGEEDVPRILGLGAGPGAGLGADGVGGGPPVYYTGPIGPDPKVTDLILDQVRAGDAGYADSDHGAGGD